MSRVAQTVRVVALAAFLSVGCAEHLHLVARNVVGGGPLISFWPPPDATSTWTDSGASPASVSLGESADRIASALRAAGYTDERWYAIGARYAHGFAVTTRLERINDDGTPKPTKERWSEGFPEASNLFWIEGERKPRLPGAGRYRVFLVAFTDLPIGPTNQAPFWNEQTWMADRPLAPSTELPAMRRVSPNYRLGTYVYEYESRGSDGEGHFIPSDARLTAVAHIRMSGLSGLVGPRVTTPAASGARAPLE